MNEVQKEGRRPDEVAGALVKWTEQGVMEFEPQMPVRTAGFWAETALAHVSKVMWLLEAAGESTGWENVKRHLVGMVAAKWRVRLYLAAAERTDRPESLQIVEDYLEREFMALREGTRQIIVVTAMLELECRFEDTAGCTNKCR